MADFEELKLTVNLTDNASAGLANIRTQITQLAQATDVVATGLNKVATSATQVGNAAQQAAPKVSSQEKALKELSRSAEETTRGLAQMFLAARRGTEAFPELALATREAWTGLRGINVAMGELGATSRAMVVGLGAVAIGIGAVGAAVAAYGVSVFKFSQEMYTLSQTARSLGMTLGQLRNMTEQNERLGISAENTVAQLANMNEVLTDLSMSGSRARQQMLSMGVPPKAIDDYQKLTNEVDRFNKIREYEIEVYEDWKRRTGSEEIAATQAGRLGKLFGGDPTAFTRPAMQHATKEELEQAERIERSSRLIAEQWRGILKSIGEIKTELLSWGLPMVLDVVKGMNEGFKTTAHLVEAIGNTIRSITMPDWMVKVFAIERGALGGMITGGPIGALRGGYGAYQGRQPPPVQGFGDEAPASAAPASPSEGGGLSGWYRRRYQQMEGDLKHPSSFQGANDNNPLLHRTGFGGSDTGGSAGEGRAQAIIKGGVYEALIEFYGFLRGGAQGGGGGIVPASFGGGAGAAAGGGVPGAGGGRGWGGGGYTALPNGSDVGPGTGQGAGATPAGPPGGGVGPLTGPQADVLAGGRRPMESGGGAAGITAPAGTPIQRAGMATVTTSGGRKFQVDARFAQNFQGFLTDYEKAGGVIGPESGTLGHRPHNASGHPIGAAIDVNQVGYGVRGRGGKTLSVETENELAAKWGLVSGANWRRPDTGHFGIRSPEAAREALIKQGLNPPPYGSAVGPGTGKGAGESPPDQSAKTVRGSWFGNAPGWHDPSEPPGSPKSNRPGIALPDKSTIGQMFEVTTPDGRKFTLPQTDYGPAKRTGRGIDITASAASQMGYTSKDFPTDGGFSYRRLDDRAALDRPALDRSALSRPTEINSTGQLNVDVKAPAGTKVDYSGDNLLRNTSMQRQTQMMPTDTGPSVSDTARSYMRGGS